MDEKTLIPSNVDKDIGSQIDSDCGQAHNPRVASSNPVRAILKIW